MGGRGAGLRAALLWVMAGEIVRAEGRPGLGAGALPGRPPGRLADALPRLRLRLRGGAEVVDDESVDDTVVDPVALCEYVRLHEKEDPVALCEYIRLRNGRDLDTVSRWQVLCVPVSPTLTHMYA